LRAALSLLLAAAAVSLFATTASAEERSSSPAMTIRAALRFEAPEIEGSAELRWRNPGRMPARTLRLLLFANRFRTIDDLNALERHMLIAGREFHPGGTEVSALQEGGKELTSHLESPPGFFPETVLAIDLGRDVAAGEEARVSFDFHTRLPNLFDVFGASEGLLVADGGWVPQPLSLDSAQSPASTCSIAPRAHVTLSMPAGGELLLNGELFRQTGEADLEAPEGRLSFVLSREPLEVVSRRIGGRTVTLYSVPSGELEHRISPLEPAREALLDTLPSILAESQASGDVSLVSLPLRWLPSAVVPGMVLLSDRLFEIFVALRPLHQRELAYAIFLQEELAAAVRREPREDAAWIAEGLAWRRAEELYQKRLRSGREVKDWIRMLNVFAIVDRFETAPRIPLRRPFFPVAASDDSSRIRFDSACGDRPPGRVVLDKLEARLRPEKFGTLIDRYRKGTEPFRSSLRAAGGEAAEEFLASWLRPYAPLNYALDDVSLNPGGIPGAKFRIERQSRDPRPDSVEIALAEQDRSERFFLDLDQVSTEVEKRAPSTVHSVTIDPDRKTIETRLDDDRVPRAHQVLLDSADVEVSSTEFGISTLVVGRRRYDYQKDLAAAPFYTSRGYGIDTGFQLHGGTPIDASLYRQNLFVYYGIQELDSTFENKQQPGLRTSGRLGGFGFRFNSYDAFWFENPAGSHHLRVFFDGYDRALGSRFDFVQTGGSLALTLPLRDDTVLAGQVMNGFSVTTGGDTIPNQGLFSLGGFRSIRGIGAEDQLGKDIFIVRAELRHLLPFRLDWNFQEVLIARRLQLKAFVDAGRVENSTRRLYDPSGFAVGVGGGFNLFYDFMGFFPTTFYLDFATRADKAGKLQVLFGAKQPF